MDDRNGKKRGGALAEINVTPLVDILLVLLIIFMVTTPTIHHGARVPTPDIQPSNAKESPTKEEKDTLTLDKDGIIKLRGQTYSKEQLYALVKKDPFFQEKKELFIHADLDLYYGQVMEVIALMRRAGIRKLGVIVELDKLNLPPSPPPPKEK